MEEKELQDRTTDNAENTSVSEGEKCLIYTGGTIGMVPTQPRVYSGPLAWTL